MTTVVLYGQVPLLLTSRKMILEALGFRVFCSDSQDEVGQFFVSDPIDLVVICHSVRQPHRDYLLNEIVPRNPRLQVLTMSARSREAPHPLYANVDTSVGPLGFVKAVWEKFPPTHEALR